MVKKTALQIRIELSKEDPKLVQLLDYLIYNCDQSGIVIKTLTDFEKELKMSRKKAIYLRDRLFELGYILQVSTKNCVRIVNLNKELHSVQTSTPELMNVHSRVNERPLQSRRIEPKAGHYINTKGPISYISGPEYIVFNYTGPDNLNIITQDSLVSSVHYPVDDQTLSSLQPDVLTLNGTASIEPNEEKRMDTTEKIRHIYQTYNETLQKYTSRRITPIPSAVRLGRGTWGENSLPAKIANWLNEVGDDWQELWDDGIIERMKTNKFLKFGVAGSDNPFVPTLAWLFDYEEAGYTQYGKHMVKKNTAPGFGETVTFKLNRVLEGKYDGQTEIATKEQLLDPGYNENKAKVIGKVYDMDKYD